MIRIREASGSTTTIAAPIIVPPPKMAILFITLGEALMQEGKYPQIKVPTNKPKKMKNAFDISPIL